MVLFLVDESQVREAHTPFLPTLSAVFYGLQKAHMPTPDIIIHFLNTHFTSDRVHHMGSTTLDALSVSGVIAKTSVLSSHDISYKSYTFHSIITTTSFCC